LAVASDDDIMALLAAEGSGSVDVLECVKATANKATDGRAKYFATLANTASARSWMTL